MTEVLRQDKNLLIQKRNSHNTQDIYCSYFNDLLIISKKKNLKFNHQTNRLIYFRPYKI